MGLLALLVTVVIGVACQSGGDDETGSGEAQIPVGQQVQAFQLPDVVSGRQVSLADYIGNQDVVIVGYMGFF